MVPPRSVLADNRRMVGKLVVVAALMFGFGYALVPLYRAICDALGINVLSLSELRNAAAPAPVNGQVDTGRTVTIEFDANARGPWDFKPAQASLDVHPGQVAMSHFTKLECFCFTEHVLQPGESRQWPVVFVVDPKLPRDVRTITLSYTFFEVGGKMPLSGPGS